MANFRWHISAFLLGGVERWEMESYGQKAGQRVAQPSGFGEVGEVDLETVALHIEAENNLLAHSSPPFAISRVIHTDR